MRAIAAARREEGTTMRLLGARPWMLRDPFVIEGLTTGAIAGAVAGAVVAGAWLLAMRFADYSYVQVLPGVGFTAVRYVVAAIIVAGMLLGVLTSVLSFRRVRA
jgi:cell division protein FtsX